MNQCFGDSNGFILEDGNAIPRRIKALKKYQQNVGTNPINAMTCPLYNLYLNPITNMWKILQINIHFRKATNNTEFCKDIGKFCFEIDPIKCEKPCYEEFQVSPD